MIGTSDGMAVQKHPIMIEALKTVDLVGLVFFPLCHHLLQTPESWENVQWLGTQTPLAHPKVSHVAVTVSHTG